MQCPQGQRRIALLQVQKRQAQCVFFGQARQPKLLQNDDGFFRSSGLREQFCLDAQQAGHILGICIGIAPRCLGSHLPHKRQCCLQRTQTFVDVNDFVHFGRTQAALARQGQPRRQKGCIVINHWAQAKHVGQGLSIGPLLHQLQPRCQRQRCQPGPLRHLGLAFKPQRALRLRQHGRVGNFERRWQVAGCGKGGPRHLQTLGRQYLG